MRIAAVLALSNAMAVPAVAVEIAKAVKLLVRCARETDISLQIQTEVTRRCQSYGITAPGKCCRRRERRPEGKRGHRGRLRSGDIVTEAVQKVTVSPYSSLCSG